MLIRYNKLWINIIHGTSRHFKRTLILKVLYLIIWQPKALMKMTTEPDVARLHRLRSSGCLMQVVGHLQAGLHDLAVHAVPSHASLGCAAVAAHLQADQVLSLAQLLFGKFPPVTLRLPEDGDETGFEWDQRSTKHSVTNTRDLERSQSPVEPVPVATVMSIILGECHTAQCH